MSKHEKTAHSGFYQHELESRLKVYYEHLEQEYPLRRLLEQTGDLSQINTWPDAVVLKIFPEGVHPSAEQLMMPLRLLNPDTLVLEKTGWHCGLSAGGYVFFAQARHPFWHYCWVLRFTLLADENPPCEPDGLLQRCLLDCQRLGITVYPKQVSHKTWDLMLWIEPSSLAELGPAFEQFRLRKAWRQFAHRMMHNCSLDCSLVEPRVWELPGSAQIQTTPYSVDVNFPSMNFTGPKLTGPKLSISNQHLLLATDARALADLLYNGSASY